jgi:2-succinyl-5-enolpyruvyl-6-hydroxy-3-cyclohexene-1-carboxylate synthase
MDPYDTYTLLGAFVDELRRCGLRDACTSPGSRGTPLLLSLAREPRIRCHSHIDERCAGFFALGLAKAAGVPVAITCTSGTAVAELMPAIVEAHEARVPLIVLSADRPPELRGNGAGQTIDQLALFGGFAKWFFEVGSHEASAERLCWMRTLACRAFWTALEGRPGVVHLNFPLREPLVCDPPPPPSPGGRPDGVPYVRRTVRPVLGATRSDSAGRPHSAARSYSATRSDSAGRPHSATRSYSATRSDSASRPADTDAQVAELAKLIDDGARGVLVAGRHERPSPLAEVAAAFCQAAGWPLLADPMSGARRGPAAIAHYDALLREPSFASSQRPEVVVRVGDLPVSKPLRTWLATLPPNTRQIALDPEGAWQDPAAVVSHSLMVDPVGALGACTPQTADPRVPAPADASTPQPADADWLQTWRSADARAAEAILRALDGQGLSEPAVAAELGVLLPEDATLFVASSMPVREIESFWPAREDPPRVLCNRGANGIDGTVSSAFGAAAADGGPVVLLIGDVALAHDIGGLLAARRLNLKLTIVLIDNDGGGIFDFLPVSSAPMALAGDLYAEHIATPTGLDFAHAAQLYGLTHEPAEDLPTFRIALERALSQACGGIVEVKTDRAANVELHRRIWSAVSAALSR